MSDSRSWFGSRTVILRWEGGSAGFIPHITKRVWANPALYVSLSLGFNGSPQVILSQKNY